MAGYVGEGTLLYLNQIIDWETYYRYSKGDSVDVAAERAALREALETYGSICEEIEKLSREAWGDAATLEDGQVVLPKPMQFGYEKLREAGLISYGVDEEYGGFGLPAWIANVFLQMVSRANAGLMTVIGLQSGVAEDIQKYASAELCRQYLPKFVSGEYQGAMALTESQAGSDLGAITTRVKEIADGLCEVTGQKIFITNGGSEVHLVLARDEETFGQSKGTTKGLSLILCPRTLPDGTSNSIFVDRLEHKLGIHGSPTCAVRYEAAKGYRIGVKGAGFKAMLDLMNHARLGVAAQGIGIAEAALEEAIRYAKERRQFGKPIAEQPLMKNMLARMVVQVEASRALLHRTSRLVDRNASIERYLKREKNLPEAERERLGGIYQRNQDRIRMLTPLAKYLATETCDDITRQAIQVHGGVGFMADSTVGKLHLDGIITTIYEGTSEIQVSFALKEMGKGTLRIVFDELEKELSDMEEGEFEIWSARVRVGIAQIKEASPALMQNFNFALFSAGLLAEMAISVIVATELLLQARVAPHRLDIAASWISYRLPEVSMMARRIREQDAPIERCERVIALAK